MWTVLVEVLGLREEHLCCAHQQEQNDSLILQPDGMLKWVFDCDRAVLCHCWQDFVLCFLNLRIHRLIAIPRPFGLAQHIGPLPNTR